MGQTTGLPTPTWEQWRRMHWRERQRVRRAGIDPPTPPLQVFLALTEDEHRQLAKQAKRAKTSEADVILQTVKRSLARRRAKPKGATNGK